MCPGCWYIGWQLYGGLNYGEKLRWRFGLASKSYPPTMVRVGIRCRLVVYLAVSPWASVLAPRLTAHQAGSRSQARRWPLGEVKASIRTGCCAVLSPQQDQRMFSAVESTVGALPLLWVLIRSGLNSGIGSHATPVTVLVVWSDDYGGKQKHRCQVGETWAQKVAGRV